MAHPRSMPTMQGASHLYRQAGRYYLRRRVPADLVPVLGRSEIKRSLDTADPRVARQRLPAAEVEIERAFDEARRTGSKIDLPSLCQKVTDAATRPLREELARDPLLPWRLGDPHPLRPDQREPAIDGTLDVLEEPWEQQLEAGYSRQVAAMVEQAGGIKLPEARQDREAILQAVSQAVLRALYDLGHPRASAPPAAKPKPPSKSLGEVMDLYLHERKPAPRTEMELRGIIRRLGSSSPIGSITKADARGYKDELLKGGSKPATVNKHISLVKALWSWAQRNDYVAAGDNPFTGLSVKLDVAAVDQRKPISREQLRAFLERLQGEDLLLARLAALTGARLGELCQLRRCDLAQEDGLWAITIGASGRVKTVQSRRRIPVPKVLVEELLHLRRDGSERPLWRRPSASEASRRLNLSLRAAGISDPKITFHSLRHLHADACRAAGVKSEVADALHGHSSGAVSQRYGSGYPAKLLAEAVEAAAAWIGATRFSC